MKLILLLLAFCFACTGAIMAVPPALHIIGYGDDYCRLKEGVKAVAKAACYSIIAGILYYIGDSL